MKYSFFTISILSLVLIGIFTIPQHTSAQFNTLLPTAINLETIPENPTPNQNVTASISSFDTDLNMAQITWKINGQTIQSGKGVKKITFKTGNLNTNTSLDISITTQQGEKITKSYSIKPTEIDLIWQASGYTPAFYRGKTLFSHQNSITFIAIPHITGPNGSEISPKNFVYKWTRNGTVMEDSSGYGRDTFTMTGSIISRALDVSVDVSSPDTSSVGFAETTVTPHEPEVLLYEKNPLYGIRFEKALIDTASLASKEIEVVAVPLFFGTTYVENPNLSYTWYINGGTVDADFHKTSRVFRQADGAQGSSYISVQVDNAVKVLQSGKNGFNLQFNTQN